MGEKKEGAKHFYAVCDGHGVAGHEVSTYIRRHLPEILRKQLESLDNSF
jgi:serine/threonine protein phosphatase PrpC